MESDAIRNKSGFRTLGIFRYLMHTFRSARSKITVFDFIPP